MTSCCKTVSWWRRNTSFVQTAHY